MASDRPGDLFDALFDPPPPVPISTAEQRDAEFDALMVRVNNPTPAERAELEDLARRALPTLYPASMRSSYGTLAFLQLGSIVAIVTLAALMDEWPPLMFWVVFLGLFAAVWVGLLWRRQVDRRVRR